MKPENLILCVDSILSLLPTIEWDDDAEELLIDIVEDCYEAGDNPHETAKMIIELMPDGFLFD